MKGSVELAPLTGLVDAIVDLTATGTTLRENHLVEHEWIADCTARLIANPVSHKLKAAAIDQLVEQDARRRRAGMRTQHFPAGHDRRGDPRAHPAARDVEDDVKSIIAEVRARRRRGAAAADRALRPRRGGGELVVSPRATSSARSRRWRPTCWRRSARRSRT